MNSPALLYNAEVRNNGTARRVTESFYQMGYKDRGMERYNRPWYSEPDFKAHDFWLYIDDGRDEIPMPDLPSPNACWLVDTHLGYEQRLKWAMHFDYVFLCQLPDVARMETDGVQNVHWLPLACLPNVDPSYGELQNNKSELPDDFFGPFGLQKIHDVAFVGHMGNGGKLPEGSNNRIDYLDAMFKNFPNSWFAYSVFFEQAAVRYARARVGFNISIRDDLNMRFFEILSYGNCLLTNRDVVGWRELGFEEDIHFLGYQGEEEMVTKIKWALANPIEREKIAKAGHKKVRAEHTYQHRIQQMLEIIGV
jgi:glycosyltransferase involved in cell wall biosynthesis